MGELSRKQRTVPPSTTKAPLSQVWPLGQSHSKYMYYGYRYRPTDDELFLFFFVTVLSFWLTHSYFFSSFSLFLSFPIGGGTVKEVMNHDRNFNDSVRHSVLAVGKIFVLKEKEDQPKINSTVFVNLSSKCR